MRAIRLINEIKKQSMSKITTPFSGGCACGAIRYQSTAEPMVMLDCDRRQLQSRHGGHFGHLLDDRDDERHRSAHTDRIGHVLDRVDAALRGDVGE